MTGLWEVQVAVMAKLNATVGLPGMYDAVAKTTARPYGTFGSPTTSPSRRLGSVGQRNNVTIDWWGNEREDHGPLGITVLGNKEVAHFAMLAKEALDGKPVELEAGVVVLLRWRGDTYLPEPERNVRRVQQVYTVDVMDIVEVPEEV